MVKLNVRLMVAESKSSKFPQMASKNNVACELIENGMFMNFIQTSPTDLETHPELFSQRFASRTYEISGDYHRIIDLLYQYGYFNYPGSKVFDFHVFADIVGEMEPA